MPAKAPYPGKKTKSQVGEMWNKSLNVTGTLITSYIPWILFAGMKSVPYIMFTDNDRVLLS